MTKVPNTQRPQVVESNSAVSDTIETHPAYALISASRVNSNPGAFLFGSDFRHRHYLIISISTADVRRSLSHDWEHPKQEIIQVALSEAQWATFVSTPNAGVGAPCTLQRLQGELVPQIEQPTLSHEKFTHEMDEHLQQQRDLLTKLQQQIQSANLSQKAKDAMQSTIYQLSNALAPNIDFVGKSFAEHVERATEKAKIEVNAYIESKIRRAGLQALAPSSPLLELPEGEVKDDGAGLPHREEGN